MARIRRRRGGPHSGPPRNADKTRLIEFGRFAKRNRAAKDEGKPETFDFLGFTHISGESRQGKFIVKRKSISKRVTRKLHMLADELRKRPSWESGQVAWPRC